MPPYYDDFIGSTTLEEDKLIQEAKKEADKYIQRIMNITLSPAKQWINHNHNGIIVWADFPQAILLSKGIPFLTQNNAYTHVYILFFRIWYWGLPSLFALDFYCSCGHLVHF